MISVKKTSLVFAILFLHLTAICDYPSSSWGASGFSSTSPKPQTSYYSSSAPTQRSTAQKKTTSYGKPFEVGSHHISLDLGQTLLVGDLTKYQDDIGFAVGYTNSVSEKFGFNVQFGHSGHSTELTEDEAFSVTYLTSGLRANFARMDSVIPYANLGLGFYKPSEAINAEDSLSPLLFGLHLGAGADLILSDQFFFGAGISLHDMFSTRKPILIQTIDPKTNEQVTQKDFKEIGGSFIAFVVHGGMSF